MDLLIYPHKQFLHDELNKEKHVCLSLQKNVKSFKTKWREIILSCFIELK